MNKPWLKFYENAVPATLTYPDLLVHQILDEIAGRYPDRTALDFFGTCISYRDLQESVRRCAGALQALGVKPQNRIALFLPNCPQMVIAFFATLHAGAIAVLINPLYTEKELKFQLRDSGAETLITVDFLFARANSIKAQTPLKRIIVGRLDDYPVSRNDAAPLFGGEKIPDVKPIEDKNSVWFFSTLIRQEHYDKSLVNIQPGDIALLQYTGGTTGISKGAMLSHRNIVSNTFQMRHWYYTLREGEETFISVLPLFHSYGLSVGLNLPVSIGATMIIFPRFAAKEILTAVQQHRATLFPGIPAIYAALNVYKDLHHYNISSINYCISGSAPLPANVLREFEQITGGIIIEGYGLTEASPVTHCNPLHGTRKIGSIGLPVPDTDCKIVDIETGSEVPPGEAGELCIKGPQIMSGYWQKPQETAQVLKDNWLFTGDIARMDEDGYFYIVERKKDMIISEGFNIYPRELDEFLMGHPKIREAAVIGVPDTLRGEKVIACVVAEENESVTQKEIINYCRDNLAKYKVPKKVVFKDELPKSAAGKVLRRTLREEVIKLP